MNKLDKEFGIFTFTCGVCQQETTVLWGTYTYKRLFRDKYYHFCSYKCVRIFDKKKEEAKKSKCDITTLLTM